jgi:uncharacterized protein (TIGR02646 family)
MLHITKQNKNPSGLPQHIRAGGSYENLPKSTKDNIKKQLLEEQGYLCAYCMSPIDENNATIEHYIPQSIDPGLSLVMTNMLAVCSGDKGVNIQKDNQGKNVLGKQQLTCDKGRGNTPITVDPMNVAHIQTISYKDDGSIHSTSLNIKRDIQKTLNLSHSGLVENRRNELKKLITILNKKWGPKSNWTQARINRAEQHIVGRDKKEPYAGILIWKLEKWKKKAK